jgi:hypothetical protein
MDDTKTREPIHGSNGDKRADRRRARLRDGSRRASAGDTAPVLSQAGIEKFAVGEAVAAARESKAFAVTDILARVAKGDPSGLIDSFEAILSGASPDDIVALRNMLEQR